MVGLLSLLSAEYLSLVIMHPPHHKLHNTPLIRYSYRMKTKLTYLIVLTFLFLFSSVSFGDDFQDGVDAYERKDYKTAYKLWLPLAEQGFAQAQFNLGVMYENGQGVHQDYKEAVRLYRLSAEQGHAKAQNNLGLMY